MSKKFWSDFNLMESIDKDAKIMVGNPATGETMYSDAGNLPFSTGGINIPHLTVVPIRSYESSTQNIEISHTFKKDDVFLKYDPTIVLMRKRNTSRSTNKEEGRPGYPKYKSKKKIKWAQPGKPDIDDPRYLSHTRYSEFEFKATTAKYILKDKKSLERMTSHMLISSFVHIERQTPRASNYILLGSRNGNHKKIFIDPTNEGLVTPYGIKNLFGMAIRINNPNFQPGLPNAVQEWVKEPRYIYGEVTPLTFNIVRVKASEDRRGYSLVVAMAK